LNGYTILFDVGSQQNPVMWIGPNIDVTEAVVTAYNASSNVAPPVPAAPSATKPKPPATGAAPHSTTTPAPKPQ
jgi:outer membrane protein